MKTINSVFLLLLSFFSFAQSGNNPGTYTQAQWQNVINNSEDGNVSTIASAVESTINFASFASGLTIEATSQVAANQALAVGETAAGTTALGSGSPSAGVVMALKDQDRMAIFREVQRRIDWFQSHVVHSEIAENIRSSLNVYNKTKNMIGMMGSTIGSLHDMTNQFNKDLKSKTSYTQQMVNEMNNFLSWKNELAGFQGKSTTYTPIFNFFAAYEAETSRFRDNSGNFSIGQGLVTAVSDQALQEYMGYYQHQIFRLQRTNVIMNDMEVREHLQQALLDERQARWLTLQVNMEIFGQNISDISSSMKYLLSGEGKTISPFSSPGSKSTYDQLLSGTTTSSALSQGAVSHTNMEIINQVDQINRLLQSANMHRTMAAQKMQKLLYAEMNPANADIYLMKRMILAQNNQLGANVKTYQTSGSNYQTGGTQSSSQTAWQNSN
jgi:hypothetical protein